MSQAYEYRRSVPSTGHDIASSRSGYRCEGAYPQRRSVHELKDEILAKVRSREEPRPDRKAEDDAHARGFHRARHAPAEARDYALHSTSRVTTSCGHDVSDASNNESDHMSWYSSRSAVLTGNARPDSSNKETDHTPGYSSRSSALTGGRNFDTIKTPKDHISKNHRSAVLVMDDVPRHTFNTTQNQSQFSGNQENSITNRGVHASAHPAAASALEDESHVESWIGELSAICRFLPGLCF